MKKLDITFHSGVGVVTGANFLLETESLKVLIDCGLTQGIHGADEENRKPFPYNPSEMDFLFITHAHIDHIGRIPKLVKDGFQGVIYSTPETRDLAELMLSDALRLQETESKVKGIEPLYFDLDVAKSFSLWKTIPYHHTTELGDGLKVNLRDAGHVLGSAYYEFLYDGKKVVVCCDLGNSPTMLLKDTEKVTDADYLIIDSVYGDRNHEAKDLTDAKFVSIVKDTIAKKGVLVIPSFSLERTQIILYKLNNLIEDGTIPEIPVYLDSPLAIKITEIYKQYDSEQNFNAATKKDISGGDKIFSFPKLKNIYSSYESHKIEKEPNPKIIIAGSGMSSGGRVVYHESVYLPDPNNTVLLIGYQGLGTLGRQIADGVKEVEINEEIIPVKARVEMLSGYSAHKDSDHLLEFVEQTKDTVKKVFVVLGEPKSSLFLVQRLRDYIGVNAIMPERSKKYEL
jgi:metallo-beta-lactamase family protein